MAASQTPTSSGSHISSPPNLPLSQLLYHPSPQLQQALPGKRQSTSVRKMGGLMAADLHLSLCFSKSNPYSHPQLCNRTRITASFLLLFPSLGDHTDIPCQTSFPLTHCFVPALRNCQATLTREAERLTADLLSLHSSKLNPPVSGQLCRRPAVTPPYFLLPFPWE